MDILSKWLTRVKAETFAILLSFVLALGFPAIPLLLGSNPLTLLGLFLWGLFYLLYQGLLLLRLLGLRLGGLPLALLTLLTFPFVPGCPLLLLVPSFLMGKPGKLPDVFLKAFLTWPWAVFSLVMFPLYPVYLALVLLLGE